MDVSSLPQVIGANYRRTRTQHGVTQETLASHARRLGLRWTASKVGDFESGRNETPLSTVLVALLALDNAVAAAQGPGPFRTWRADGTRTDRARPRVTLSDLVASDSYIRLTAAFEPVGDAVTRVCSGQTWELASGDDRGTAGRIDELLSTAPGLPGEYGMKVSDVEDMRRRSDLTETRVAKRLGIDADTLIGLSWRLWKCTFGEERDRRAVSPARRGQVSRELQAELRNELQKERHE